MRCLATSFGVVFLVASAVVNADSSLWIPDVDPQPISVGVLGAGSDGRTTYQVQQGSATGTFTDPSDFGFPGTATLVEGPSDAVLSFSATTQGETLAAVFSCSINNGQAVCAEIALEGTSAETDFETETVSPILVQGGGSASGASSSGPTSTTASASQTQGARNSQASAGSSPTSSGAGATGTSSGKNSAGRDRIVGGLFGPMVAAGSVVGYVL